MSVKFSQNEKYFRQKSYQSTHFIFDNFFPENGTVYEIMWKNVVEPEKPQMTIW
jgi:hypothetical protein